MEKKESILGVQGRRGCLYNGVGMVAGKIVQQWLYGKDAGKLGLEDSWI